jgi:cytochrome c biogenesis protein CcdA
MMKRVNAVISLVGSVGWTSCRLPRLLSVLYWVAGIEALFVYVQPGSGVTAVALGLVISIWQGPLLWKDEPGETPTPEITASQPDQA